MFEYKATVKRVVDGDTLDVETDLGFNVKMFMRIRLKGVDTPETWRPVNEAENIHGEKATSFVVWALKEYDNEVVIRTYKAGASIYGRYTADVLLGKQQHSLAELLIENGFAKNESYE